ncbi:MAG: hypothetical protein CVV21_00070 [Candidatus Goldiibacteriota bacterium HGW-Goldbacteria-1]|jgi:hypothetical protein|nr:MAG: hypothetical protein CVV21_00070 [Candidatus Goldiibacteriota bacterium HGW-Goldbacteria-1]
MKRTVMAVMAFVFAVSMVQAASWTVYEDYTAYKAVKDAAAKASDEGNTTASVAKYKEAASLAAKSATKEIQAWQLNSAAYELIKVFKKNTDYSAKIEQLSGMTPSKEKFAAQKDIAVILESNMGLLDEAKGILEEAKALEGGEGPAEKIASNLDFISWVNQFLEDTKNPVEKKVEAAVKEEVKK